MKHNFLKIRFLLGPIFLLRLQTTFYCSQFWNQIFINFILLIFKSSEIPQLTEWNNQIRCKRLIKYLRPVSLSLLASSKFTIENQLFEAPASGIGNLRFQQLLQRLINLSPSEIKFFRWSFLPWHPWWYTCHFSTFVFAIAVWGSRFRNNFL